MLTLHPITDEALSWDGLIDEVRAQLEKRTRVIEDEPRLRGSGVYAPVDVTHPHEVSIEVGHGYTPDALGLRADDVYVRSGDNDVRFRLEPRLSGSEVVVEAVLKEVTRG